MANQWGTMNDGEGAETLLRYLRIRPRKEIDGKYLFFITITFICGHGSYSQDVYRYKKKAGIKKPVWSLYFLDIKRQL